MKKVAIIGPTGSIGSGVYRQLKNTCTLVLVVRNPEKIKLLENRYGDTSHHETVVLPTDTLYAEYIEGFQGNVTSLTIAHFIEKLKDVDIVINCAGVINRYTKERPAESLFINGFLPHLLSHHFKERLIHVTTNCVYDGLLGKPYDEASPANATDLYGASKYLGEPKETSLVLRTSTIGPEIHNFVGLLEWVRKQEGQTIKGFTKHLWNGITTLEFGKICEKIIQHRENFPKTGLYHLFSEDISKFDMVRKIAEKYNINCTIIPDDSQSIDRRLSSLYDVNAALAIQSFDTMLAEL